MIIGIPFIGGIGQGRERRGAPRKATEFEARFRFITPLPLIVTKMFNIEDSGKGFVKNVSSGGVMLEIPVTTKGLSFLYELNKALESSQSAMGMEKSLILKPGDFSTVEIAISSDKKKASVSLLGLPVWVKYIDKNDTEGIIRIGLKFPETSQQLFGNMAVDLKSVLD